MTGLALPTFILAVSYYHFLSLNFFFYYSPTLVTLSGQLLIQIFNIFPSKQKNKISNVYINPAFFLNYERML